MRRGRCRDAGLGWANPSQAPRLVKHSGAAYPGAPRRPVSATILDSKPRSTDLAPGLAPVLVPGPAISRVPLTEDLEAHLSNPL